MADEQTTDVNEADLSIEDFVARGNARDRGETVEPVVADTPTATEPPEAAAADAAGDKPTDKRVRPSTTRDARKKSIQAEIDDLTTAKHTTRREVEAAQAELTRLRGELAELQAKPPQSSAAAAPPQPAPQGRAPMLTPVEDPNDPEPTLDQFAQEADPHGAWSRAVARWETRQEHRRIVSATRAQAIYQTRTKSLSEKLSAYDATHPGFLRGLHPSVVDIKFSTPKEIGTALGDLIVDSDHTAALLDHFSHHLDEFQRLSTLHPMLVARELGRIESRFDAASSTGPASKPQAISHAKPIPKPVGGSPVVTDDDDDEGELPIEEFVRRGNSRDAARSRAAHR